MASTTAQIASKVRGVAAENRYTQQRIAETIGVSRAAVVERINGRVAFTAPEILALAQAMDVPVSRFFPGTSAVAP
ncbi:MULTISPECIES: helix-turn-helix domain-containing protein [unclassified Microbacterium]|uniref:helix-turn-helix domain-containing protein n=1 Tax=unclassified Microbacterium TaxID=2609290 RepID=UPI00364B1758